MENVNRIIAAFIVSLSEKDTKVPIVSANTGVALKINCVDLICSKSGMPKVQEQPDDEMQSGRRTAANISLAQWRNRTCPYRRNIFELLNETGRH